MKIVSYKHYDENDIILRDKLAIDRTILANERTLLAYLRTGFAFIFAGLTFVKFFNDMGFIILGLTLIPIGLFINIFGFRRYYLIKANFNTIFS